MFGMIVWSKVILGEDNLFFFINVTHWYNLIKANAVETRAGKMWRLRTTQT